jgi:hypothetical protein
MIQINLNEYINGYSLIGYDLKDGKFLNEISERKVDLLLAIQEWVKKEIKNELEGGHNAIKMQSL